MSLPLEISDGQAKMVEVVTPSTWAGISGKEHLLWQGDVEEFLDNLPMQPLFDLVVTSPPYNIGKPYETATGLDEYRTWQERVISKIVPRLKPTGSLCWQVGNYVNGRSGGGGVYPLDYLFHPIFEKNGLTLQNRIVWRFGHGLHCKRRFSGRYEVVLWYTSTPDYTFNLDDVRVKSKYPGKRYYKGPKAGQLSCNPRGKNPEDVWDADDVWDIPNVKSNHVEKTAHPCQFPVGLIERLVLALTNEGDVVFDPFAGVSSAGVAATVHKRRFWGCEICPEYMAEGVRRVNDALAGRALYRPHDKPLYDYTQSKLSIFPKEFGE